MAAESADVGLFVVYFTRVMIRVRLSMQVRVVVTTTRVTNAG